MLLWLVLSVLVRVLDNVLVKEAGGAGGAGGGGGALIPPSLGTVSSSLDSGIAGRGAGTAEAATLLLSGESVDAGDSSGLLVCCVEPLC